MTDPRAHDAREGITPEPGGDASWSARTFASLGTGNYRRFFAGQAVSLTGTWMQSVALAWLVLDVTGSASLLGLTVGLQFLPVLLVGPYAGVLVDRTDKRRLIIATQCAAAAQAFVLGALAVTGAVTLPWVLVLSASLGLVNSLDNPARQAFVREMVPDALVRNAVSLNSVLVNVARAVGPAIAGLLIASVGVGACFLLNAASFAAAILAFTTMDTAKLFPSTPVARAPGQLRQGLSYVWHTPALRVPLLMMALVGTLTYEFQVSLPALVVQTLGGDARSYGLISSAMGFGAVLGGVLSAGRSVTGVHPMVRAALAFGGTVLLAAASPGVAWAVAALVPVGAASIWFLSTGNATLQIASSQDMRGRVMALWSVAFLGSTTVGGPIIGWVAQHAGARWALGVGGASALLAAALGVATRTGGSAAK